MKNESIDKIEKAVENILPTSSAFINELDYSVIFLLEQEANGKWVSKWLVKNRAEK